MFKEVLRRNLAILVLLGMLFSCINIGVYANEDLTQQVQSVENNKVEFDEMLRRNGFDPIMYRNIDIMKGIRGLEPEMFPSFDEYLLEFERRLAEEGPILLYKLRRESMRRDAAIDSPLNAESVFYNEPVQEPVKENANRFIIKYKNSESSSKVQNQLRNKIKFSKSFDKQSLNTDKSSNKAAAKKDNIEVVKFNQDITIEELTQSLENANIYSEIEYIQPDYEIRLSSVINDQWGLLNTTQVSNEVSIDVNVSPAWSISEGDGIIVAVIDSGIDITHEGLSSNIWINENESGNGTDDDGNGFVDDINGWNFINNTNVVHNSSTTSDELHGTHVAGIIAANGGATFGVAPKAKILPLKVFENGSAYTSNVIEAIQYAESMGAKVANCSWGMSQNNQALKDTMASTAMLFVCAAGNNGTNNDNNPVYPASYNLPNVISVASIGSNGTKSSFSNYGVNTVHVSAPGQGIRSTIPNNSYGQQSGTSMSAAFVSGQAALVLSEFLDLNATQAKNQIIFSSDRLSTLQDYIMDGNKINCEKSLSALVSAENIRNIYQIEDNTSVSNDDDILSSLSAGDIKQIASGGNHNLLLMNDGTVYAWGGNGSGQLGVGTTSTVNAIVMVKFNSLSEGETVKLVSVGGSSNMAMTSRGKVYAWGGNYYGALGDGTSRNIRPIPVCINDIMASPLYGKEVTAISTGGVHSIAVTSEGKVYSWGLNEYGQLGDGTLVDRLTPICISGIETSPLYGKTVTGVSAGDYHSMVITSEGKAYAWGYNCGQLGDGTMINKSIPICISDVVTSPLYGKVVTVISAGVLHSMAVTSEGKAYAWGYNFSGEVGDGTSRVRRPMPVCISDIETSPIYQKTIVAISTGYESSMALTSEGKLYSWGCNYSGQLGDNTWFERSMPMCISDIETSPIYSKSIYAISSGVELFSTAVTSEGKVYIWGDNYLGGFGPEFTDEYSLLPTNVKIPKRLSLNVLTDATLDYALTASSITNPSRYVYHITYDTSKYIVDDLCKSTSAKELTAGHISGTNIVILKHDATIGLISITFNYESEGFTGILNNIVFKAISDGKGRISVINYVEQ